ncbi:PREDICTED: DNA repair protein RAD50 [Polistes dominula]|uniref:DNA repair protein RAD50 n=1 Tax=Polistes dominula TaxID=743375 RepID=A0ABM1IPC7_POLDO|nr:PREDICTED: DNA repair protein RAD50 [Polistes dominula]XP_015182065.1 PREDICTED: DNA repair protein RAD50 [Polistes dominula]
MSRIRQLSICGVRNFDDQEQARIRFGRPLTLILGANGTGKTTLIESLKFATTGDFPPGSDRGKSFIHDKRSVEFRLVKGCVKAEFVSANGNTYTISRVIECVRNNSGSKFKTVDNTLSRKEKGASKAVSITNRCIDINTEVVTAMGVSKAILNYVIFCHQEEFSWPLDDGKKLKEKFDEIFESVRFNKALENYLKCIKNLEQNIRILKVEKDSFKNVVNEVEDKEKKRQNTKDRLEEATNEITAIDKELETVIEQIQELEQIDAKYKALMDEKDKKKFEYDMNKKQIESLQENIQLFKGTMRELSNQLELYDNSLAEKAAEITQVEEKLQRISSNETKITNAVTEKKISVGTLKEKLQDQEKKIAHRNKTLNDMLSKWNMKTVIDADSSNTEDLVKKLEDKVENLKQVAEVKRQKRNMAEEKLQKEVDVLRSEHSKIESEINIKNNEVIEIKNQVESVQNEISMIGASANKLNSLKENVALVNKTIEDLSKSCDSTSLNDQINAEMSSRDSMETEINTLDEEIEVLHKHATLQAEISLHKSTMKAKEEEIQCFKKKHEDAIKMLLETNELPHTKLKDKLVPAQKKLMDRIKTISSDIQTEQQKLISLKTTLKCNKEELEKKISELDSNKQKVSSICYYKDFDEILLLQSKRVKDLQDKRGMHAYQNTAYKEYMKQFKEQDPCCPLCHRNFDKSYNIDNLIKEMEEEIENQPVILKRCENELKAQQNKYDNMLQLKPIIEKINVVEEIELPLLEDSLQSTEEQIKKHETSIEEKEKLKSIPEDILNKSKNLFEDIMLWDRLIDETNNLKEKIRNIENVVSKTGTKSTRTVSEAQARRNSLKVSLKDTRNKIQRLQSELNTYKEKYQHACEKRNTLYEQQLKIESNMKNLGNLESKKEDLNLRQTTLKESVQKLRDNLLTADNNLEIAVSQLDQLKKENWEKEKVDRTAITDGERQLFELNKIQNEVNAFDNCNIPDTLAKLELEIQAFEKTMNENTTKKQKLEAQLKDLKDAISQQETRKRDLSDNLELRKLQFTAEELQQQYQSLNEKIENMNRKEMIENWKKYQSREQILSQKKNVAIGKQEELQNLLLQYNEELKKECYRLARKNYMEKCIELTIQNEVIADLRKYCKVLDAAMMKYHKERMESVNKIIKTLWNAIYIGNDTTCIEIRTNDTIGTGSAARRSYNYKLVQMKNGMEMDMRGRCSAGQKVLASIIIRLALAETFCKDCGVLALDEPTTNLDEENANSLANALNMIVKSRSRYQKNFQLIVISHDEKFLVKLSQLNNSCGYYELYRKENGLSSVRFRETGSNPVSDLHFKLDYQTSEDEERDNSEQLRAKKRTYVNIRDNNDDDDDDDDNERNENENRPQKKRFVCNF